MACPHKRTTPHAIREGGLQRGLGICFSQVHSQSQTIQHNHLHAQPNPLPNHCLNGDRNTHPPHEWDHVMLQLHPFLQQVHKLLPSDYPLRDY